MWEHVSGRGAEADLALEAKQALAGVAGLPLARGRGRHVLVGLTSATRRHAPVGPTSSREQSVSPRGS